MFDAAPLAATEARELSPLSLLDAATVVSPTENFKTKQITETVANARIEPQVPSITFWKEELGQIQVGDNWHYTYNIVIRNDGNTDLANINLYEDLDDTWGDKFVQRISIVYNSCVLPEHRQPTLNMAMWSTTDNPYNGIDSTNLFNGDGYIKPGEEFSIRITVALNCEFMDGSPPTGDTRVEGEDVETGVIVFDGTDLDDEDDNTGGGNTGGGNTGGGNTGGGNTGGGNTGGGNTGGGNTGGGNTGGGNTGGGNTGGGNTGGGNTGGGNTGGGNTGGGEIDIGEETSDDETDDGEEPIVLPTNFAFDAMNNESKPHARSRTHHSAQIIESKRIFALASEPIFSGMARPGTKIVCQLYDRFGNPCGTNSCLTDAGGNWLVQVHCGDVNEYYRVEFSQHQIAFDVFGYIGFDPANSTYQELAVDPSSQYRSQESAASNGDSVRQVNLQHRLNNRTLGFGRKAA